MGKSSTRGYLWLITAVFVISQGGKRSLCMADEGEEEEVVSVEVHVDGMTIRGAARREAPERRVMTEEGDKRQDENVAIWDVIDSHVHKLNAMAEELINLKRSNIDGSHGRRRMSGKKGKGHEARETAAPTKVKISCIPCDSRCDPGGLIGCCSACDTCFDGYCVSSGR